LTNLPFKYAGAEKSGAFFPTFIMDPVSFGLVSCFVSVVSATSPTGPPVGRAQPGLNSSGMAFFSFFGFGLG
jgi:hypothetical protein